MRTSEGLLFVVGACFACARDFSFNPYLVPSVETPHGTEPVCQTCIERLNALRQQGGLEPCVISTDAYAPASLVQICDEVGRH